MADPVLTQGTIEYLIFTWTDLLGVITDLTGTSPVYDVKDTATGFSYYSNAGAAFTGLKQYCLIDTTTSPALSPSSGAAWLPVQYKIWVKLTSGLGSEKPRVGSFLFSVSAG